MLLLFDAWGEARGQGFVLPSGLLVLAHLLVGNLVNQGAGRVREFAPLRAGLLVSDSRVV